MNSFVIPADYCVALFDAAAFPSFVDSNWTLTQLREHFVTQMNSGTMLAWGTAASGNWRIAIATQPGTARGYREFTHRITVQLYDPAEAEWEEVFYQESPHVVIELIAADGANATKMKQVPWFVEGN